MVYESMNVVSGIAVVAFVSFAASLSGDKRCPSDEIIGV